MSCTKANCSDARSIIVNQKLVLEEHFDAILIHYFYTQWQHSLIASLLQMILVFAKTRITKFQDSGRSGNYNKAGYTAQDAPSTRLKITRDGPTDGPTDRRTDGHTLL